MKKLLLSTLLLSVIAFSGNAQQTMDYLDWLLWSFIQNNVNNKNVLKIEGSST
jgi:hypothetical protein